MTNQSENALKFAGQALLHAAMLQARIANRTGQPQLNDAGYRERLAETRQSLAQANPSEDHHVFLATKMALEILETTERGEDTLGGLEIFKALVESIHGGERKIDFGGRRRQGKKFPVDKQYLRAAAVTLWQKFPEKRDQLALQSRTLIGVGSKAKLEKIVDKFHELHDFDTAKSGSPLSVHMPLVEDLIEHYGYRELKDFA